MQNVPRAGTPVVVVDLALVGQGKALLEAVRAQRLDASERLREVRVDGGARGRVDALHLDVRRPVEFLDDEVHTHERHHARQEVRLDDGDEDLRPLRQASAASGATRRPGCVRVACGMCG